MPTRIEIELTSSSADGSWTWRAAGAREPRGVLDGSILPGGAAVGDQLRVETEHDVDGIRVLSVVPPKEKPARTDRLELLPTEEPFEPVLQQRARGGRPDDRRSRGPCRERPDRADDSRRDRRDRPDRGDRAERSDRGRRTARPDADRRGEQGEGERHRHRPHFTPPPEVPQRPKPKRLRPGKQHRVDVLASLPEEQRPIAELALQGIAAVRQRLRDDNARLKAEGKPEMPEAGVMRMAEELIPRLRVADWIDRAEAAKRQLEHLDLRDLRSVVASADDPLVARDESTRTLAAELKAALVTKQEEELALWLADVEAALDVGRVVRALRLSSVPPKAGVPFPGVLAARLAEATTAALQPVDGPDRWSAVLEAAAFSPVRSLVAPTAPAEQSNDELLATVRRLAPLLPQIAALYGVDVPTGAAVPKPLRPTTRRREPTRRPSGDAKSRRDQPTPAKASNAAAPDESSAADATGGAPEPGPDAVQPEAPVGDEPGTTPPDAPDAAPPAGGADSPAEIVEPHADPASPSSGPNAAVTDESSVAADATGVADSPAETVEPHPDPASPSSGPNAAAPDESSVAADATSEEPESEPSPVTADPPSEADHASDAEPVSDAEPSTTAPPDAALG